MLEELFITLKSIVLVIVALGALATIALQWGEPENADTVYSGATPDDAPLNTLPPTYTE